MLITKNNSLPPSYNRVTNANALAKDTTTTAHPVCATRLFVIPLAISQVKNLSELKP